MDCKSFLSSKDFLNNHTNLTTAYKNMPIFVSESIVYLYRYSLFSVHEGKRWVHDSLQKKRFQTHMANDVYKTVSNSLTWACKRQRPLRSRHIKIWYTRLIAGHEEWKHCFYRNYRALFRWSQERSLLRRRRLPIEDVVAETWESIIQNTGN